MSSFINPAINLGPRPMHQYLDNIASAAGAIQGDLKARADHGGRCHDKVSCSALKVLEPVHAARIKQRIQDCRKGMDIKPLGRIVRDSTGQSRYRPAPSCAELLVREPAAVINLDLMNFTPNPFGEAAYRAYEIDQWNPNQQMA